MKLSQSNLVYVVYSYPIDKRADITQTDYESAFTVQVSKNMDQEEEEKILNYIPYRPC